MLLREHRGAASSESRVTARQKSGLDRNGGPQVDHFRWADDAGCDDRADFVLRDYSDLIIVSVGSDRGRDSWHGLALRQEIGDAF